MVQEGKCTCCGSRTIRKYPASMSELDMAFCGCNPRTGEVVLDRRVTGICWSLVLAPDSVKDLALRK